MAQAPSAPLNADIRARHTVYNRAFAPPGLGNSGPVKSEVEVACPAKNY